MRDLEDPEVINTFKTGSKYAKKVELATLRKLLATLRAAIHWGQAQTPPLFDKSPFQGSDCGEYQPNIQTGWDALRLLAYGIEPRQSRGRENAEWNRLQLRKIDLHWHDLRHEGASRLLADGVDIRIIQLILGHVSLQQTQRCLNVTDEELQRGLEVNWKRQP